MDNTRVSIVAAMGKNRVIGKGNTLLWHIPEDLKRFKSLTLGHPVIMGRKTFDSIVAFLGKPLPGRTNIVITRDEAWQFEGAVVAHSFEGALEKARAEEREEIFVIGGAQIYEQTLPYADRLYLTLIDDEKEGDVFFPPYEECFSTKVSEESGNHAGLAYRWVTLEK